MGTAEYKVYRAGWHFAGTASTRQDAKRLARQLAATTRQLHMVWSVRGAEVTDKFDQLNSR